VQQSVTLAEVKLEAITKGDVRTKQARIAECEQALRETAAMRKSFFMAFQLLKQPEKQPYRLAMEAYDRRIANVEQKIKWEKAAVRAFVCSACGRQLTNARAWCRWKRKRLWAANRKARPRRTRC